MGKTSEALMGKRFKLSKFTSVLKLAIVRVAVLKNQRQARCNVARNDVVQLLQQNLFERAVIRVELVIKEQNMADVYTMIDNYCNLLLERAYLVEQERECPEELKEAAANLIHVSTRCGEFPELQEIRDIFTAKYGREFTARAVELRNSCGVNPTMIQKLSTRQIEYDKRALVVNEIAADFNVHLAKEENSESVVRVEKKESESIRVPVKSYMNAADAAQAAFESAAHAAAAARAAVELSRFDNMKSLSKDRTKHEVKKTYEEEEGDVARVSLGGGEDVTVILNEEEDDDGERKEEMSSDIEEVNDGMAQNVKEIGELNDIMAEDLRELSSSTVEHRVELNKNEKPRSRNVFSRMFGRNSGAFSVNPRHVRSH